MAQLFRRGDVWYAYLPDGSRRSTRCRDKQAAKVQAAKLEREHVDPAYRAANATSISDAIDDFLGSRKRKGCAQGTLDMYDVKTRHIARVFGEDTALARVDAQRVDGYVDARLDEGAKRSTIGKELTALRGILKVAKRAGKFSADLDAVLPSEWSNDYEPRTRALSANELAALLATLATPVPDRYGKTKDRAAPERNSVNQAAAAAWIVATGGRLGEMHRAQRADIDLVRGFVLVRSTKTKKRGKGDRYVPITPFTRILLEEVLRATVGRTRLFDGWANVQRDIGLACERAGIERCSPNDLRRTHSRWLRDAGVEPSLIAPVMGHADSRMVERVYGKLPREQVSSLIHARLGAGRYVGGDDEKNETKGEEPGPPIELNFSGIIVPRDGIEPPTRGFSILSHDRERSTKAVGAGGDGRYVGEDSEPPAPGVARARARGRVRLEVDGEVVADVREGADGARTAARVAFEARQAGVDAVTVGAKLTVRGRR